MNHILILAMWCKICCIGPRLIVFIIRELEYFNLVAPPRQTSFSIFITCFYLKINSTYFFSFIGSEIYFIEI